MPYKADYDRSRPSHFAHRSVYLSDCLHETGLRRPALRSFHAQGLCCTPVRRTSIFPFPRLALNPRPNMTVHQRCRIAQNDIVRQLTERSQSSEDAYGTVKTGTEIQAGWDGTLIGNRSHAFLPTQVLLIADRYAAGCISGEHCSLGVSLAAKNPGLVAHQPDRIRASITNVWCSSACIQKSSVCVDCL